MGDRRWNLVSYHLEPNKAQVFFQMSIGGTGAPTLLQYNNKTGLYTPAPLPGATNTFGTQAGSRGVLSVVRNSVGNYTVNLQQSFTRFLQGQLTYKVIGSAVYPNVIFPYPESTIRLPLSAFTTLAQGSAVAISAISESGNTVSVTSAAHGLVVGQLVKITGQNIVGPVATGMSGYNGVFIVTSVPSSTTFTYTCPEFGLAAGGAPFGTAQGLGASPGPFMTLQFLNPTTSAVIELATGDIVEVQVDLTVGSGT